jgi:DNA-binding PadR family transcriptional regulator
MIREVREASGSRNGWTDGMLYLVLRRLEAQGRVESEWRLASSGKRRRYYRIKGDGREVLAEQKARWQVTNDVLNRLWREAPCLT